MRQLLFSVLKIGITLLTFVTIIPVSVIAGSNDLNLSLNSQNSLQNLVVLNTTKGQELNYHLPVNVNNNIKLKVNILPNFTLIPPTVEPEQTLTEFIPVTDKDPYNWSEIVTISPMIGTKITAVAFLDFFIDAFKKNATMVKVIETERKDTTGYQYGYNIIQYQIANRNEIVLVYAASGPDDLATVQYAIYLPKLDKINVNTAIQKLKTFIKNNIEFSS